MTLIDVVVKDNCLVGLRIRIRINNIYTSKGTKYRRLKVLVKKRLLRKKLNGKLGYLSEKVTSWAQVRDAMNQVVKDVPGFNNRYGMNGSTTTVEEQLKQ